MDAARKKADPKLRTEADLASLPMVRYAIGRSSSVERSNSPQNPAKLGKASSPKESTAILWPPPLARTVRDGERHGLFATCPHRLNQGTLAQKYPKRYALC